MWFLQFSTSPESSTKMMKHDVRHRGEKQEGVAVAGISSVFLPELHLITPVAIKSGLTNKKDNVSLIILLIQIS